MLKLTEVTAMGRRRRWYQEYMNDMVDQLEIIEHKFLTKAMEDMNSANHHPRLRELLLLAIITTFLLQNFC